MKRSSARLVPELGESSFEYVFIHSQGPGRIQVGPHLTSVAPYSAKAIEGDWSLTTHARSVKQGCHSTRADQVEVQLVGFFILRISSARSAHLGAQKSALHAGIPAWRERNERRVGSTERTNKKLRLSQRKTNCLTKVMDSGLRAIEPAIYSSVSCHSGLLHCLKASATCPQPSRTAAPIRYQLRSCSEHRSTSKHCCRC